jgi:hypothetical protein
MNYKLPTPITHVLSGSATGRIRQSERFYQPAGQRLIYFEVEVPNGFALPTALPYGVLAEVINKGRANESTLTVWVNRGYYSDNVQWRTVVRYVKCFNEFISLAKIEETIVLNGSQPDCENDVWESQVVEIDEVHSKKTTVRVVETNAVIDGEFDEVLAECHTVTRTLVQANVAENETGFPCYVNGDIWTTWEEIKCGWYVKTEEQMTEGTTATVGFTRNWYWPAVLQQTPEIAPLYARDDNDERYTYAQLIEVFLKESYSGPCKCLSRKNWSASAPTGGAPSVYMITDFIQYNGIFFNITIPECLHSTLQFNESVGNHPVLEEGQFRIKSFPGTNLGENDRIDWPNDVTIRSEPRPYKGGWTWENITIYKPGTV